LFLGPLSDAKDPEKMRKLQIKVCSVLVCLRFVFNWTQRILSVANGCQEVGSNRAVTWKSVDAQDTPSFAPRLFSQLGERAHASALLIRARSHYRIHSRRRRTKRANVGALLGRHITFCNDRDRLLDDDTQLEFETFVQFHANQKTVSYFVALCCLLFNAVSEIEPNHGFMRGLIELEAQLFAQTTFNAEDFPEGDWTQ
jgi:hypothetical protein